ncbi:flagellar biosynthesis protein FlhF [Paraburkholderia dinghuensis]|uniref:Flagellar biosynthesis protein FlhF n=1 Tax=Paraburkholderia dinghuensis TaxID=2305225 RepID=A0A3N6PV15_9BURK|nr:flagellar biosynthesis protein FlhF [Paraburkholderia dinghuensis]RQH06040.1 flagellar biosynthesis protein FlhF [Paraburkholderia dinghuensis]
MNIRKFIGGNSRDALRLVREALGADAVVLSNRTLDDGSVEIVALADRDLAAIAPADAAASAGLPADAKTRARPKAAGAGSAANPYASGMPDLFSSVFGASPEVGGTPGAPSAYADAPGIASHTDDSGDNDDADVSVSLASTPPAAPRSASTSAGNATNGAMTGAAQPSMMKPPLAPLAPLSSRDVPNPMSPYEAAALLEQAARSSYTEPSAAAQPRTMAESNPWLIDHARRIVGEQEAARVAGLTPSAAMARGFGKPADPVLSPDVEAMTPDWAREAADVAARRAAQRLGLSADAAASSDTPQTMSEAIRARVEQVVNETVMSELASIRGMMEEQFAGLVWGDRQRRSPIQGSLTKQMFAAGFSAQLVKMVINRLPAVETEEAGMEWIHSVLESNLPVLDDEEALMERGGVFALMGPTGVGKTTTTAKLAARCVMRFGASRVALLTTDSYRIGGHEQLRIFGKILGVSVHAVRDGADLQLALNELKNKHIVLIDTIGMSQRDRAVTDQIAMLCGAGRPVQRLLVLSATNHGDTLNEVVQAYQSAPDKAPLAGCVLTKLDEATNLGGALDTVLRYKLPVYYVSTGQKVPENLYVAQRRFLVRSAFCVPREDSPFVPHEDDIPALLSALSTRTGSQAPEVRFG